MPHRASILVLLLAVLVGGCSTETAPPDTTPSTLPPTITTLPPPTTATPPPATTIPPAATLDALPETVGLGDSRYPHLGNPRLDVEHYTIDLSFDPTTGAIGALTTVDAVALEELDTVTLDFAGYELGEVTVDGVPAAVTRGDDELLIIPAASVPAGEGFTVGIAYTGLPRARPGSSGLTIGWISAADGTQYVVAEPDAAHSWFPCNDHPLDKATYTFRVTTPDPLVAVANGTLVDTVSDVGATTRVYEMDDPMATYLATVIIGDLVIRNDAGGGPVVGVPVRNVLPPGIDAAPPPSLARQSEMLAFLAERFGPYPFDLYGSAFVPDFPGALENQTLSVFGTQLADLPILEFVLVHELAHQWFGNDVSLGDWGDIWLNEGLATYSEWLWLEHTRGREVADSFIATTRTRMADLRASGSLPPPGDPPAGDLFNASTYQIGALTVHALRLQIGDDAFFATLRTYTARHAGGNVRTADFVAVAEETAGRPLGELFDAWLFGDTLPEL